MTIATLPVSAQSFDEAVTTFVRGDFATALRGFRLAAEQGHGGAQSNLGLMYATGRGVPENHAEAVRWFRLAAEQGVALAQSALGLRYAIGRGVPEDTVNAYAWSSIAGAKEHMESLARRMTHLQIAETQLLAGEYWALYVQPFQ